jgi:hypothetical protein
LPAAQIKLSFLIKGRMPFYKFLFALSEIISMQTGLIQLIFLIISVVILALCGFGLQGLRWRLFITNSHEMIIAKTRIRKHQPKSPISRQHSSFCSIGVVSGLFFFSFIKKG